MTDHDDKNVEQGEHSFIAGGSVNLYSHFGNQYDGFSKKLGIGITQDPAITLRGIYPKDIPSDHKNTCSAMFIVARNWKQPRYPPTDEWTKKM